MVTFVIAYSVIFLLLGAVSSPDLLHFGQHSVSDRFLLLLLVLAGPVVPAYLISKALMMRKQRTALMQPDGMRETSPSEPPPPVAIEPDPMPGVHRADSLSAAVSSPMAETPPAEETEQAAPAVIMLPSEPPPPIAVELESVPEANRGEPPSAAALSPVVETPLTEETQQPAPVVIVPTADITAMHGESLEDAGDYLLRLHNMSIAASARMHNFLKESPSVRLEMISTVENDIQLNLKLIEPMALVKSLSIEFPECRVMHHGRIILVTLV